LFLDCLSAYAQSPQLRYDHATTEDFQNICETVGQQNLNYFFDQWIYDEYYPIYEYSFFQQDTNFTVSIQQTQSQYGRRAIFEMPIQLLFHFVGGEDSLITVWNDSVTQEYTFQFSRQVTNVQFDPDHWILRTVQLVNSIEPIEDPAISQNFYLYQNHPNPFNNLTRIAYFLSKQSEIEITLYTITGKKIATIYKGIQSAGHHSTNFNGSALTSGVYFYRIKYGRKSQVRKMILLK
jgi:hypothetical protein